jgi:hypothetical protein
VQALITVRAADGTPIGGAAVTVAGASQVTDFTGRTGASLAPSGPTSLQVSKPGYVPLTLTVEPQRDGSLHWDDPGTAITPGSVVAVDIRLSRMTAAPVTPTTAAGVAGQLEQLLQGPAPVQTALTAHDGEYLSVVEQAGLSAVAPEVLFRAATDPAGLIAPAPASGARLTGWDALNHSVTRLAATRQGTFAWLVWGGSALGGAGQPRFLVAVWRPRTAAISGSSPRRDAIIFFTPPTTAARGYPPDRPPFEHQYPFGLVRWQGKADQPYTDIASDYLFGNFYWMCYQILAARRDATLIFPVIPAGAPGMLVRPEVLGRLAAEVILWAHRERRGRADPAAGEVDTAPASSPGGQAVAASSGLAVQAGLPSLGVTALAGYSEGVTYVKAAMLAPMSGASGRSRDAADESASPYQADPAVFIDAWQEVWDFDGTAAGAPGALGQPADWAQTLTAWIKAGTHRVARCYHSDQTWGWNSSCVAALRSVTGGAGVIGPNAQGAAESHGPTGSAVWLPRAFLAANPPAGAWNATAAPGQPATLADAPSLWDGDAHRAPLRVGLAHAAAMSQLTALPELMPLP